MLPLVAVTGFFGYLLVYAAVAHGGRYSARPWDALTDAGAPTGVSGSAGAAPGGAHPKGVLGWITSHAGKLITLPILGPIELP